MCGRMSSPLPVLFLTSKVTWGFCSLLPHTSPVKPWRGRITAAVPISLGSIPPPSSHQLKEGPDWASLPANGRGSGKPHCISIQTCSPCAMRGPNPPLSPSTNFPLELFHRPCARHQEYRHTCDMGPALQELNSENKIPRQV